MLIQNSSKSFNQRFGKDFIAKIEMQLQHKVIVICHSQFEIPVEKDKVIDFSIFENRNLLVVGFPFNTKDDDYILRQHREYYTIKPKKGIDHLIDNIVHVTRSYLNGDYDLIKK